MPFGIDDLALAYGLSAGLNALSGSRDRAADRDLSEAELAFRRRQYGDRAPLRTMAMDRLREPMPERPDLTADFADPSNPFYRAPQALGFGSLRDPGGGRPPPSSGAPSSGGDGPVNLGDARDRTRDPGADILGKQGQGGGGDFRAAALPPWMREGEDINRARYMPVRGVR